MSFFIGLDQARLLKPVVALAGWTFVQEAWMYATRIPALYKYNVSFDEDKVKQEKYSKIPVKVQRKADNFNNLHEQPQVFYAIAIILTLLGDTRSTTYRIAWTYTTIRVIHSLWHNLVNEPWGRFSLFACSSFTLFGLTLQA
ncbi:hypothetical protein FCOIX_14003, partial [Fusarium coicis]